jgi:molybdate transport system substrate-binding protein
VADSGFPRWRFLSPLALALSCLGLADAVPRAEAAAGREEVAVFAAASLADALTEIGNAWEAASGNHPVFNFGASSDLARQIRAGAPADVFFSADSAQMDALERQGLVRTEGRSDLLSNTLVVIVPESSSARMAAPRDLAAFQTIALADPQAVPAGVYARGWLEGLGLWGELAARVVPMLHVRAALAAVESGNAEAGIVYRTDAARSRRARIVFEVPREQGPRILYPVAPLATSGKRAAEAFVRYLRSPAAREVFVRHGFLVLGGQ